MHYTKPSKFKNIVENSGIYLNENGYMHLSKQLRLVLMKMVHSSLKLLS